MPDIDSFVLIAIVVYVLAGMVKGTIGIGLPTTAVSLMAQVTDARSAVTLVVIPMFVTNLWQVIRSGRVVWVLQSFWRLALTMTVGIGVFALYATSVSVNFMTLTLGLVVTLFALVNLYQDIPAIPQRFDSAAQITAGASAGVIGGIAGVWSPPMMIYLSSRKLTKEEFVSTVGLLLMLGSMALGVAYMQNGIMSVDRSGLSAMLVLPAMLGFMLGEKIRNRMSGDGFHRAVLIFFLLMGLNLIRRAVMDMS